MSIQAVLFDLDGTLVDTAPDLGHALNLLRARHGLAALAEDIIRPYASHGSRGLLEIGFGLLPTDADFNAMRDAYLTLYDQVLTRQPQLFDGMPALLTHLESTSLAWGIVTNKPRRFTTPIVNALGLNTRAACVISGDDAPQPKPSPQTLLLACEQMQIDPQHVLYIGDAARDIEAGRAAGMHTLVALFGYLGEADQPHTWGADGMVASPLEVMTWLASQSA